jgi:hypothetical protein
MRVAAPLIILAALSVPATSADAKKPPRGRWEVSRTSDPITGKTSCVVAAPDQAGGLSMTRIGLLYPFVEMSSEQGLLVGVSSGGRYRMPSGDIIWRVDDRPFRTLLAQDNPVSPASATAGTAATDAASKAMQDAVALTTRMTTAVTATSTAASGDRAREMLAEMLAGQGLLFRSAHTAPAYGLPGAANQAVGQYTDKGMVPYPLDASFRAALAACGIAAPETSTP